MSSCTTEMLRATIGEVEGMKRLTSEEVMRIHYETERCWVTGFDDFAAAIEREVLLRAAELCQQKIERDAEYGGRFGGYGNFMGEKTGGECARELIEIAAKPGAGS